MAGLPKEIEVFIDGASRGNPGSASIGVVIYDKSGKVVQRLSRFIGISTNNFAEYMALIYGLQEAVLGGASKVAVKTDSELLAKQMNGEYKIKDNSLKQLFLLAKHLTDGLGDVSIEHVVREQNKEADRLANEAIDDLF